MAWLSGWAKRRKVTVSNTNIDSDLTHFPLLLTLGTSVGTGNTDVSSIFDELVDGGKQVLTGFTETDPNSKLTVTRDKVLATDLNRDESAYVYRDMGADYFDGDFEFNFEIEATDNPGGSYGQFYVMTLANSVNDFGSIKAASGDMLGIGVATRDPDWKLTEVVGGTEYSSLLDDVGSQATKYYATFKRDESVGTYGTIYLYLYSDADRTTLVDSTSLALHSKQDFRYLYALQSQDIDNSVQRATGYIQNIRLTTNDKKIALTKADGTTQLYAEIEKWDDANETAIIWVSKSDLVLSSSGTTDLFLYYDSSHADNTTYIGDTNSTPAESVWDSNSKMVQHMADGASTSATYDSTSNNADGTKKGANEPIETTGGKIGNAQNFDGTDDYVGLDYTKFNALTVATVEGWINRDASDHRDHLLSMTKSDNTRDEIAFEVNASDKFGFDIKIDNTYSIQVVVNTPLIGTGDRYLAVVLGTGGNKLYIDGTEITSGNLTYTYGSSATTTCFADVVGEDNMKIGARLADVTYDRFADGIIDEVRISDIARSAAWIKANYYAQTDALVSWGDEEEDSGFAMDTGVFTLTGQDIGLLRSLQLAVTKGEFILTGISALLVRALKAILDTGSFILTGLDIIIGKLYCFVVDTGNFVLTGIDATFQRALKLVAGIGSFTLTGISNTFQRALKLVASTGNFILTGIASYLKGWFSETKHTTSWTNDTKHSTTWTEETKHTTNWTNEDKH